MAHTPSISGHHPMVLQGLNADSVGMPETGEFDFMNYVLGLQVPTAEDINPQNDLLGPPLNKNDRADEGDQPLLDLFKTPDNTDWQAFAAGTSQPMPLLASLQSQIETPIGSDVSLTDFAKSDSPSETRALQSQTNVPDRPESMDDKMGKLVQGLLMENEPKAASPEQTLKVRNEHLLSKYSQAELINLDRMQTSQPDIQETAFEAIPSGLSESKLGVDLEPEIRTERKSKNSELDTMSNELSVFTSQAPESKAVDSKGDTKPVTHPPTSVPEMFKKVESMVHQGGGKMTITLTPPSLGQVEIQVKARGKNVEIEMKSESDSARMTIEGGMEELKASLQSQDLNLSKMEVQVAREMDTSSFDNLFGSFANQNGAQEQGSRETWRDGAAATKSAIRNSFGNRASASIAPLSRAGVNAGPRSETSRLDIQI